MFIFFLLVRHEFDDLSPRFIDIVKYVSVESKFFEEGIFYFRNRLLKQLPTLALELRHLEE